MGNSSMETPMLDILPDTLIVAGEAK